jgi:hypothetical protein
MSMNNLKKFELMEKIVRQLQDLQHSQQAIIEKIGKIEIDNFDLNDKNLEKVLSDIHQRTADDHASINTLLDGFSDKTDTFGEKNNVEKLKEQQEINEAKGNT